MFIINRNSTAFCYEDERPQLEYSYWYNSPQYIREQTKFIIDYSVSCFAVLTSIGAYKSGIVSTSINLVTESAYEMSWHLFSSVESAFDFDLLEATKLSFYAFSIPFYKIGSLSINNPQKTLLVTASGVALSFAGTVLNDYYNNQEAFIEHPLQSLKISTALTINRMTEQSPIYRFFKILSYGVWLTGVNIIKDLHEFLNHQEEEKPKKIEPPKQDEKIVAAFTKYFTLIQENHLDEADKIFGISNVNQNNPWIKKIEPEINYRFDINEETPIVGNIVSHHIIRTQMMSGSNDRSVYTYEVTTKVNYLCKKKVSLQKENSNGEDLLSLVLSQRDDIAPIYLKAFYECINRKEIRKPEKNEKYYTMIEYYHHDEDSKQELVGLLDKIVFDKDASFNH